MRTNTLIILLISELVSGCASLQPKNEYSASVQPGTRTQYLVDFKWGPTYALAPTRDAAVETMLKKTELMPQNCSKGIKYLRGGETEGGWGWAEFECK